MKDLLKVLKLNNFNEIMFTGGECTTYKYLLDILELSKKMDFKNIIFTNGLNVNNEILDYVDIVNLSLDGPKDIHNYIRQNNRSYQNVIQLLDTLREREIWTNLQVSVSDYNVNHLDFLDSVLLDHLNIRTVYLALILNFGNAYYNNLCCDSDIEDIIDKKLFQLYEDTRYHFQFKTSYISKYDFIQYYVNEIPSFPVWFDLVDSLYYVLKNTNKLSGMINNFEISKINIINRTIHKLLVDNKKIILNNNRINVENEIFKLL